MDEFATQAFWPFPPKLSFSIYLFLKCQITSNCDIEEPLPYLETICPKKNILHVTNLKKKKRLQNKILCYIP